MTPIDESSPPNSFSTTEIDVALRALANVGYCVIRKMIDSLPKYLSHYGEGYTGYDGAWRRAL